MIEHGGERCVDAQNRLVTPREVRIGERRELLTQREPQRFPVGLRTRDADRRERSRLKNQPELRGFLVSGELREEHFGREVQATVGNRLGPTLDPPAIAPEQRSAALRST